MPGQCQLCTGHGCVGFFEPGVFRTCQVQTHARRTHGEGTQETLQSPILRTTSRGHPGMSAWGFSNLGFFEPAKSKRTRAARMVRELKKLGYRIEGGPLPAVTRAWVRGVFRTWGFSNLPSPNARAPHAW